MKILRLFPLFLLSAATGSWCQPAIDLGLLSKILRADVMQEMPSQSAVDGMLRFEWARAQAENVPTLFIACTEGGYPGVAAMLRKLTSPEAASPLFTDGTLSCHVVEESVGNVQEQILPTAQLVVPLPAPLKLAKGLFDRVRSGSMLEACEQGFTVELSSPPPFDVSVWEADIRSGSYAGEGFYWASPAAADQGASDRSLNWQEAFAPNECASVDPKITTDGPEARIVNIQNVCKLTPPCLLRMLAYVATRWQVSAITQGLKVSLHTMYASGVVQSGVPTLRPIWSAGLLGEGQIIQVSDTGVNVDHCWFSDPWGPVPITTQAEAAFNSSKRKVIQYVVGTGGNSVDQDGHGTHCAGTVAGYDPAKSVGTSNTGVAPNAKLAIYDIGNVNAAGNNTLTTPGDLRNLLKSGYNAGARIFSISWGIRDWNTYYYLDSHADEFLSTYQDAVVMVAVGNTGWNSTLNRIRRNTVATPALGKNILGVGSSYMSNTRTATDNTDGVSSFSSIGPTADGRLKPDVLAPGEYTSSAASTTTCGEVFLSGTSMATPLVAGHAALVRQYFTEGWYPSGLKTPADAFTPSGALLRAMLINSATRATFRIQSSVSDKLALGQPPDIHQGFGIVRLVRVLRIGNSATSINLFVQDWKPMQTGNLTVLKFSIPPRQQRFEPFECTLTWADPPSSTSAALNSINDLDLSATLDSDARNRTTFPNNLSRPDRINNVEKIRIVPTPGDVITVRIRAASVNVNGTQNYAFVASGTFASAAWYCQDTRQSRQDELYRTEHCRRACSFYYKNAVCCKAEAGDTCDPLTASPGLCQGIPQPAECIV